DIYSLGCVLFSLVTGRTPFEGAESGAVMAMHLREPIPVPSRCAAGVPAAVDHLVRRCMAKDPALRYTASALASAIDAVLQMPAVVETSGQASAPFGGEPCTDTMPTLPGVSGDAVTGNSPRRPAVIRLAALA